MNAQALTVGETVTVKQATGNASVGHSFGFTAGFILQFGNRAVVERVTGKSYVLRFNNLLITAMQEDLAATKSKQFPEKAKRTQHEQPQPFATTQLRNT